MLQGIFKLKDFGIRVKFTFASKWNQLVSKWSVSVRSSDGIKSVNKDKLIPFIGRHMNLTFRRLTSTTVDVPHR